MRIGKSIGYRVVMTSKQAHLTEVRYIHTCHCNATIFHANPTKYICIPYQRSGNSPQQQSLQYPVHARLLARTRKWDVP